MLCCAQIRALAADQQWDALDAFAQDRRSPVGLEPFIAAARAHGAPTGVVARCTLPRVPRHHAFPPGRAPCMRACLFACVGVRLCIVPPYPVRVPRPILPAPR